MIIILAVASGLARFIQFIAVKICYFLSRTEANWHERYRDYAKSAMVFYMITTTLFCFLFVGLKRGAATVLFIVIFHFGLEFMTALFDELEDLVLRRKTLRDLWAATTKNLRALAKMEPLREYTTRLWRRGELVLLIVLGVIIFAGARAGYVTENYGFQIGSNEHEATIFLCIPTYV